MAPRLTRRRWRLPLWDGGGALPSHAPVTRTLPRRPRLRADKGRPCGSSPFFNCYASRKKKTTEKTKPTTLYRADVKCTRSKCRALCAVHAHVLSTLHAVLAPQRQPPWQGLNPVVGALDPIGMCSDAQFQIRNRNKAHDPLC